VVYRPSLLNIGATAGACLLMGGVGSLSASAPLAVRCLGGIFIVIGLLVLILGFRAKLTIDGSSVTARTLTSSTTFRPGDTLVSEQSLPSVFGSNAALHLRRKCDDAVVSVPLAVFRKKQRSQLVRAVRRTLASGSA